MQELQLNILQQSQLLQAGETAKSSGQLHQLQTKQQQLVAQLQVIVMLVMEMLLVMEITPLTVLEAACLCFICWRRRRSRFRWWITILRRMIAYLDNMML